MLALNEFLVGGVLIGMALVLGRLATPFGFPRVAVYMLVGVLLSPQMFGASLGIWPGGWVEGATSVALGVIAYLIGGSITGNQLRRLGRLIITGMLGESLGALLLVGLSMWLLLQWMGREDAFLLAVSLGVLAISTAPAATLAVIHQYRSRGRLTDSLLGIVALDDAMAIIGFSLLMAVISGTSLSGGFVIGAVEITGALILGACLGWLLSRSAVLFGETALRLPLLLAFILLCLGMAEQWHLSLLLTCMSLGFFTRAFSRASAHRLFHPIAPLEETLFILFFTMAGMHFDHGVFQQQWGLILLYFIARILGKVIGTRLVMQVIGAPTSLKSWLGLGLVPQAGVAIGLSLSLSHHPAFADTGVIIINIILGTTLLYELIGPFCTRFALQGAGEINVKREKRKHDGF